MPLLYFRPCAAASWDQGAQLTYAVRIGGIVVCGASGAALGWALTSMLDWTGAAGAFAAAAIAMAAATLLWAVGVALSNALRRRKGR